MTVLALLAGCGGSDDVTPPPTPTPSEAATELDIRVWPEGRRSGEVREWTLRCSPDGGTLPNPRRACRQLAALDRPFFRPRDAVCTEIYGGPAVAVVRGTLEGGDPFSFMFSRTDGCEISLWERHDFLFPVTPASA